jgi:hypothetical protein
MVLTARVEYKRSNKRHYKTWGHEWAYSLQVQRWLWFLP